MLGKFIKTAVTTATLSVAVLTASSGSAFAQTGEISFNGGVDLFNSTPATVLRIDFLGGANPNRGVLTPLAGATGVFAGACGGTTGSVSDLDVADPAPTTLRDAGNPFLTFGTCSFTNTSFAPAVASGANEASFGSVFLKQTDIALPGGGTSSSVAASLSMSGILTGGGLPSNTFFSGVFTTQFSNETIAGLFNKINTNGVQDKSISATFSYSITSTVPEPSTYALMGAGLLALGVAARRRRLV